MTDIADKVRSCNINRRIFASLLIMLGMIYNNLKLTAKISSFCLHFLIVLGATDTYRRHILL